MLLHGLEHCNLFGLNDVLLFLQGSGGSNSSAECSDAIHQVCSTVIDLLGNTLLFSLDNGLGCGVDDSDLLCRSLCICKSSIESIHFSFKCELSGALNGSLSCSGSEQGSGFGLNDSLLLGSRVSSFDSSSEGSHFSHQLSSTVINLGETLLLSLDDCLGLRIHNNLLLCRSLCICKSGIESIHFSCKCELSGVLAGILNHGGSEHCGSFVLDNRTLFGSVSSSLKSSSESGNLSRQSVNAFFGRDEDLLLSLSNGSDLSIKNCFLLCRGLCICHSSIEFAHIVFELNLINARGDSSSHGRREHSGCFGLNNSLLLGFGSSRFKEFLECDNFGLQLFQIPIRLGNTLLLSLNDGLDLSIKNCFLFFGSCCSYHCNIQVRHILFELCLFGSLSKGSNHFGREHHSGLFLNETFFCFYCGSGCESSVESSDVSLHLRLSTVKLGKSLLLCVNNRLDLRVENVILLFGSGSTEHSSDQCFHLIIKARFLFCQLSGLSFLRLVHNLCFGLNNRLLLRSGFCRSNSRIECIDFSIGSADVTGLGNTVLLRVDNRFLLFLNNYLLFGGGGCIQHHVVEGHHFGFKVDLFRCLACCLNSLRFKHELRFVLNNSLLLLFSFGSSESSAKCCNFVHSRIGNTGLGNTLLFSLNNRLFLLFDNYLLLCRSLSLAEFCVESFHLCFESNLFSGFACVLNSLGSNHCTGFDLNDCFLLRNIGSCLESGCECCDLSHSRGQITGLGNALLFSLNNCLFLLFNNFLLICGSLYCKKFCVESIHFSFESELFSGFSCRLFNHRSNHSLGFGLNNCLFLRNSSSGIDSSNECGEFRHSRSLVAGIGNALLLSLNNCLLLLFNNYLLLCRSLGIAEFCIESIHFSLESELFSRFACNGNNCLRSNHCTGFDLNDCFLLRNIGSCLESGCECCDLSHSRGQITGLGNALLFSLNNCLFLLFNNFLLICGSLYCKKFCVESIHFSFESELFSGFSCRLFNHRSNHSLGFGLNNCLFLRNSSSGIDSSNECGEFRHSRSLVAGIGNALLLSLNNCLLLLFNNYLLLCRSLGIAEFCIESIHFSLESELFSRFACNGNNCLRSNHGHCFGLNDCLLLRSRSSGIESCGKRCNFSHSGSHITGLGNAFLLGLNNGFLLLFNNYLLFSRRLCCEKLCVERIHLGFKSDDISRFASGLSNRFNHSLCFCLDNCLLLRNTHSGVESCSECGNISHSSSNFIGLRLGFGLGNASLLSLNNCFLLLFNNSLLL